MKNSHKGFIVPLLLVIIAVLLVGAGAYVYMQNKQVNQSEVVTPPSTTQTSDWKTYANTQYGFSFKYPANEAVSLAKHQVPWGTDLIIPDGYSSKGGVGIEKDGLVGSLLRYWIMIGSIKNLAQYVSGEVAKVRLPVTATYTTEKINGIDAYTVRYEYPSDPSSNRVYIQDSRHLFIFDYVDDAASQAKELISTFKFNNP